MGLCHKENMMLKHDILLSTVIHFPKLVSFLHKPVLCLLYPEVRSIILIESQKHNIYVTKFTSINGEDAEFISVFRTSLG